jgi:hypothetical protein
VSLFSPDLSSHGRSQNAATCFFTTLSSFLSTVLTLYPHEQPDSFVTTTIMRTFITPYILLALATSSALAAPLLATERDNGNGNTSTNPSYPSLLYSPFVTVSPDSSPLLSRQGGPIGFGPGPELTKVSPLPNNTSPNDCGSNKPTNAYKSESLLDGPGPWTGATKRYLQSFTRRSSKRSSDILKRDGAATPPSANDLFAHYFRQAVTGKKRSRSPIVNRDVN